MEKIKRLYAVFVVVLLLSVCVMFTVPTYSQADALAESISGASLFNEKHSQRNNY